MNINFKSRGLRYAVNYHLTKHYSYYSYVMCTDFLQVSNETLPIIDEVNICGYWLLVTTIAVAIFLYLTITIENYGPPAPAFIVL